MTTHTSFESALWSVQHDRSSVPLSPLSLLPLLPSLAHTLKLPSRASDLRSCTASEFCLRPSTTVSTRLLTASSCFPTLAVLLPAASSGRVCSIASLQPSQPASSAHPRLRLRPIILLPSFSASRCFVQPSATVAVERESDHPSFLHHSARPFASSPLPFRFVQRS